MDDMNVRENEVEENETNEEEMSSAGFDAGALLAGAIGGFIAYAAIEGAKKLRVVLCEKWKAKKQSEITLPPVENEETETAEEETESEGEEPEE